MLPFLNDLSVVVYLSIANEECVQVVGILEGLLTLTCFIVYGKSFMAKDVMTMLLAKDSCSRPVRSSVSDFLLELTGKGSELSGVTLELEKG